MSAWRTDQPVVEVSITFLADGPNVVRLTGDLDAVGVLSARSAIMSALDGSEHGLTLDVSGVQIFGSKAVRLVEELAAKLAPQPVRLVNVPSHVQTVLDIVDLHLDADIRPGSPAVTGLIGQIGFERIIAQAVLRGRDAACITKLDLDAPDGPEIVFVNRAFTDLTGYSADEVMGRSPKMLQGPLSSRAVLDRLRTRLGAGLPFSGETVNYRSDGSPFIMNWRIVEIADSLSGTGYYLAMQSDRTELRRLTRFEACLTYVDLARSGREGRVVADQDAVIDAMLASQVALMEEGVAGARYTAVDGTTRFRSTAVGEEQRAELERLAESIPAGTGSSQSTTTESSTLSLGIGDRGAGLVVTGAHPDRLRLADPHLHEQLFLYAFRDDRNG